MLFHSHAFLFLFLPVALLGFFTLGRWASPRAAGLWLTAASLFFYGWWNPRYLPIIVGSVLVNYLCGAAIAGAVSKDDRPRARRFLTAGITANLLLLAVYKYAGFVVANLGAIVGSHWTLSHIELPLAISFFTFTQIAYLTDAYHGRTREYDLGHYSLFVTFFPHLIAGPIVLYRSLMPQFARPETYRFQGANFAAGLTLLVCGLAKKVLVADSISPIANGVFNSAASGAHPGALAAWTGAIAYSLQLYFDFSGYSDMAIGLARMFNTRFPLNFDSPYKAGDIIDFWRRWHITLSTFLRDHLYIPLGGNRLGPVRRYVNLFITMLLGGLWHGAGWTFILWGGLHGAYLCLNHGWLRVTAGQGWAQSTAARFAGRGATLLAVIVGWVVFRAANLTTAVGLLTSMAGRRGLGARATATGQELAILALAAAIALLAPNSQELFRVALPAKETQDSAPAIWRWTAAQAALASVVFALAVLHLSRISDFLYFQF